MPGVLAGGRSWLLHHDGEHRGPMAIVDRQMLVHAVHHPQAAGFPASSAPHPGVVGAAGFERGTSLPKLPAEYWALA